MSFQSDFHAMTDLAVEALGMFMGESVTYTDASGTYTLKAVLKRNPIKVRNEAGILSYERTALLRSGDLRAALRPGADYITFKFNESDASTTKMLITRIIGGSGEFIKVALGHG